jgi:predicted nucleic acid-binding protein
MISEDQLEAGLSARESDEEKGEWTAFLQFLRDSQTAGFTLIGPPLLIYETESVLQTFLETGTLPLSQVDAALAKFAAIPVQLHEHPNRVRRAREIARQFHQPKIYDSLYAALAELRACEFWTADRKFSDAVNAVLTFVKYLPDYP